ncbi:xanthomonadin biosynthesis 3-hydroxybenozate--AMP ligase XanA2 [Methyloparacoccus murrellii]
MSSPFAQVRGQTVGRDRFLAESARLAAALPAARHAINLCTDRYRFSLGLVACLLRGVITLLPPDRSQSHLQRLRQQYPGALLLVDEPCPEEDAPVCRVERPPAVSGTDTTSLDLPAEQPAVIAFTSGSTGQPQPHAKTWGTLAESARLIDASLGGVAGQVLVATVPPQHMYGLELSVLLPLCRDAILSADRPFYPADIAAALAQVPAPRRLVTTPIHLRALLESGVPLGPLQGLVSATAALDPQLARRCEQQWGAPLHEIYGCTEAGSLAGRRPARTPVWRWFQGIRVQQDASGRHRVLAGHLPEPVALADQLEAVDATGFRLLGRCADLVNIAGKRASLALLNQTLLDIEGVVDGTFHLPDAREAVTQRLVVLAVAPDVAAEAIRARLRAQLDAAFWPRAVYRVASLPRNETGKLSRAALDRLLAQCQRQASGS